jgi:acetoin utilization deacetylase AcuC-like enzyme
MRLTARMRPPSRQRRRRAIAPHPHDVRRGKDIIDTATTVFYSATYTAARYGFDTTRKSAWIADSLADRPIAGVELAAPPLLTEGALEAVHSLEYVRAVKTGQPRRLAESSGFPWDPGIWSAVRASNGGAVAAALRALATGRHAGSLSSGLHHARRESGAGFCTFNGLALAAREALAAGARRVLILDLDAHVGDGTMDIVARWPRVIHVDIAVSPWSAPAGDPSRSSLDAIARAGEYLPTLERRLGALDTRDLDLCIYNAGMDPHEDCDLGGLPGLTTEVIRERERMVFAWARSAGLPVAFVLAGGYAGGALSRDALVDLHRLTIEEAAAGSPNAGVERHTRRPLRRAEARRTGEGCCIDADGNVTDAAFHAELLGNEDDDPFAFDDADLLLLSPGERMRFLKQRHSQSKRHAEFLRDILRGRS